MLTPWHLQVCSIPSCLLWQSGILQQAATPVMSVRRAALGHSPLLPLFLYCSWRGAPPVLGSTHLSIALSSDLSTPPPPWVAAGPDGVAHLLP